MSSSKGPSKQQSSYDAFSTVDKLVAKDVLGSDGAASWQDFRKDHKSNRTSVAPKAPLKKADKLGSGFQSWEEERAHEDKVREKAGHASTGSGYTTFKKKNSAEDAAERKRIKQIEARIRPDKEEYFIPSLTFQGWKFNYIFTTRPDRGTGYYWDGMDSIKQLRGDLKDEAVSPSKTEKAPAETSREEKPKKKKRKKNEGPTIINDPNNPMEQVAAVLQRRNQVMGGNSDPTLPIGWEAARDPFSGKTYYYCRATGERKWEKPLSSESSSHNVKELSSLPAGWKSATDKSTGKTYYYNKNGETRWEKPTV